MKSSAKVKECLVLKCLDNRPSVLSAREIGHRILQKMKEYVEVFVVGMAA